MFSQFVRCVVVINVFRTGVQFGSLHVLLSNLAATTANVANAQKSQVLSRWSWISFNIIVSRGHSSRRC